MLAEKILGLEKGLSRPDKKLVNSASKAVKNGLIEIVVFMDKDQIKVSVSDNGVPCNYLTYEDYKVEKGYDELSGVGIKLIKRKSKRVDYSRLLEMNVLNISV